MVHAAKKNVVKSLKYFRNLKEIFLVQKSYGLPPTRRTHTRTHAQTHAQLSQFYNTAAPYSKILQALPSAHYPN
jgi:hypothetical protein